MDMRDTRQINDEAATETYTHEQLSEIVWSNLDSAIGGGHEFNNWTVEEMAVDLLCYACDCEDLTEEQITPHVEAWCFIKQRGPWEECS